MYIVHARLEGPVDAGDVAGLRVALHRSARPADGLEHLHLTADRRGLDVTMFVLQPTLARAEAAAERICRDALGRWGDPSRWTLTGRGATLAGRAADLMLLDDPLEE